MNGVTCDECLRRLFDEGGTMSALYEVGNPARPSMGHLMYHSREGRIALCAAARRVR
jgi:hypothetical protein